MSQRTQQVKEWELTKPYLKAFNLTEARLELIHIKRWGCYWKEKQMTEYMNFCGKNFYDKNYKNYQYHNARLSNSTIPSKQKDKVYDFNQPSHICSNHIEIM